MDFQPPYNHQAIFQSDVWNVFHSLGRGYSAFLIHPSNGPTVWCTPPKDTTLAAFYMDEDVIQELIDKGLTERKEDALIQHSTARYELTATGRDLYEELSGLEFAEGQQAFVERVRPFKR